MTDPEEFSPYYDEFHQDMDSQPWNDERSPLTVTAEMGAYGPVDGTGTRDIDGSYVAVTVVPKNTGTPIRYKVSRLGAELLVKELQAAIGGR